MSLVAVPPSLPTPLPHDAFDDAVLDHRTALIAVAQGLNALDARVSTRPVDLVSTLAGIADL